MVWDSLLIQGLGRGHLASSRTISGLVKGVFLLEKVGLGWTEAGLTSAIEALRQHVCAFARPKNAREMHWTVGKRMLAFVVRYEYCSLSYPYRATGISDRRR